MICRNKIKWSRQTRSSALLDQEVCSFIAMFSNRLRKDIFGMCYCKRSYRKMLKDSVCSPVWFDSGIWRKRSYALVKNSTVQKIRKTDFTDNRWVAIATNYRVFLQLFAWNLWKAKRFKYRHVYSLRTIWMAQQTWRKCPGGIGNRHNSAQLRWYCVRWSEHESLYKSNKNEIKQRRWDDAA